MTQGYKIINNMIPYRQDTQDTRGHDMAKKKTQGRTPAQNFVISRKIEQLQSEGIREDRAIAAAFRMHRAGELSSDAAPKQTAAQLAKRKAARDNTAAGYLAYRQARKQAQRRQKRRMQAMKRKK